MKVIVHFVVVSAIGLFIAAGLLSTEIPSSSEPGRSEIYFPRLSDYADLYLRGSYDLLHMMRVRELGKIGYACKIAAQRKMNGGKIVSFIGTPHIMVGGACSADVPGNPGIAPEPVNNWEGYQGHPEVGNGDFLIVANPSKAVEDAHNCGCFVLGAGFPMTTNRHSPPDFNDHPEYKIEPMCDLFIYTWGPPEDGLVTPSLTPQPYLKILPTSPMTVVAYWLIMAQLAHNLAFRDTMGTFETAQAYLDTLMFRLGEFHARYIGDINRAGEIIAGKVLRGGKIHPWSPRAEFWIEASGTAGGLMGVYELDPEKLTAKDVVILAASDSTPIKEIAMARKVREKGAWMLGFFPFTRGDGFPMEQFKSLCNMSFDTISGDIYGVINIPGYPNRIIPTTATMNNYAFWAVVGAYVQAMEKRGVAPYYWMSFHVPGGKAYDDSILPHFKKRGY